jgi:hypothetical protein
MSKFNQHLTTALQALGFSVSDERATADVLNRGGLAARPWGSAAGFSLKVDLQSVR